MRTVLRTGGMIDIPTVGEISAAVGADLGAQFGQLREDTAAELGGMRQDVYAKLGEIELIEREKARAVKWMRFPRIRATVAGSAVKLTGTGPEQGFLWSVGRLVISGLASSSSGTPDIVNFYYTDSTTGSASPVWWQLNGNSFGTNFDPGAMIIRAGETLNAVNVGTIAATGTITIDWDGWEVLEERAWRLVSAG